MILTKVRHEWPEARGFALIRPKGYPEYTFLHFLTPVQMELGGQPVDVCPGGCIFFPSGVPQHFTAHVPLIHNWLHATDALLPWLAECGLPVGQVFYPGDTDFITEHFRKMELEFFSNNPQRELLLDGYLREFLILLSRALIGIPPIPPVSSAERLNMKEMRNKVLSRPYQKWTVAEMAALVSLSPSRFHAVYRATFGISPLRDLIEARMEYTKNLLLQYPDMPLPQLAEKLGYNDQFHLIRQFRKETGMTPGQFRKENQ